MSDMRVELDGDWAEIRHANKIPHGRTMEYREVFFEMVAASPDDMPEDVEGLDDQAKMEFGRSMLHSGVLMADQRLKNAFALAIVKEWSFGPVTLDTLLGEVPTADLETIFDHCDVDEYVKVLTPDFDDKKDHEPNSPTSPSAP